MTVGIDVGQRHDPTAIAVTEGFKHRHDGGWEEYQFKVRFLERLELGTAYPDVSRRVVQVVQNILRQARSVVYAPPKITIAIDITGVGRPVCDILRKDLQMAGVRVEISEVTFTHGDRLKGHLGQREVSLGKAYLVSRLQAMFQTRRIELPASHREAVAMKRELQDYEIKISEDANDKYGAFRVGSHDDLVTALGLATLLDVNRYARVGGSDT